MGFVPFRFEAGVVAREPIVVAAIVVAVVPVVVVAPT